MFALVDVAFFLLIALVHNLILVGYIALSISRLGHSQKNNNNNIGSSDRLTEHEIRMKNNKQLKTSKKVETIEKIEKIEKSQIEKSQIEKKQK